MMILYLLFGLVGGNNSLVISYLLWLAIVYLDFQYNLFGFQVIPHRIYHRSFIIDIMFTWRRSREPLWTNNGFYISSSFETKFPISYMSIYSYYFYYPNSFFVFMIIRILLLGESPSYMFIVIFYFKWFNFIYLIIIFTNIYYFYQMVLNKFTFFTNR
jgi:hypothetical protein